MKKTKLFPLARSLSIIVNLTILLFLLSLVIVIFFVDLFSKIAIIVLIIICLIAFSVCDKKIYPLLIKCYKKNLIIHTFLFNYKKIYKINANISLTEIAYLFGSYVFGDRIKFSNKDHPPENFLAFIISDNKKFIDKSYLKCDKTLQEYVDYCWNVLRDEKFIIIDGTYKNYKYLRQFFDAARFRDVRGIEQDMIAEYEAKLQQEKEEKR